MLGTTKNGLAIVNINNNKMNSCKKKNISLKNFCKNEFKFDLDLSFMKNIRDGMMIFLGLGFMI